MNLLPLTFFQKKKKKKEERTNSETLLDSSPNVLTRGNIYNISLLSVGAFAATTLSGSPKHLVLLQVWRYCFFIYHF